MKRLIIHLGTHKAASTAIQNLLARNRRRLLKHGFFYPEPPRPPAFAQHSIAWDFIKRYNPREKRPVCYTLSDALADFHASGADTLILSSEDFLRPTFEDGFLREFFGCREAGIGHITVAAYVRNRKGFFTSSYNQWVKSLLYSRYFDFYLKNVLNNQLPPMRYTRALGMWAAFADEFRFLPFEPAGGAGADAVEHRLLIHMGIPGEVVGKLSEPAADSKNASIGPDAVLAFLCLNERLNRADWFRAEDLEKRGRVAREALDVALASGWGYSRFRVFSPQRLAAIREEFGTEDRAFARRYLGGDWYDIFPADLEPDEPNELIRERLNTERLEPVDRFVEHLYSFAGRVYT